MMPNLMLITHAILLGKDSEFDQWYLQQEGKDFIYVFLRKFLEVSIHETVITNYNVLMTVYS